MTAATGIGARVLRTEDKRFLTGTGRYVDDLPLARTTYAYFLRSPHAHAKIKRLDTAAAKAMPGVVEIFTGKDTADAKVGGLICGWVVKDKHGEPHKAPPHPVMALDTVRYVGDTVAMVVANSHDEARDAAEAIKVDYDVMPANVDLARSFDKGVPQVHPEAPGNLIYDWEIGVKADADAAFAKAAHVTRLDIVNNRLIPNAMEPRAAAADYDKGTGNYTLWSTSQNPHVLRLILSAFVLGIPEHKLRVIAPDVGGGFGSKIFCYNEETMVTWAATRVGRPIKWTAERSESFMTDAHGRDHVTHAELALDKDGKFLALKVDTIANMGAYLSTFSTAVPTYLYATLLAGQYTTPVIYANVRAALTHTAPVDAYRGAGRPEATFVIESIVSKAAAELKMDPAELRRKNFIPTTAFPYQTPVALQYDSGNYPPIMDEAIKIADYEGFELRRAEAKSRGKLRGIGFSSYIEACGLGPSRIIGQLGGGVGQWELAQIKFNPTGNVQILTGAHQPRAEPRDDLRPDRVGQARHPDRDRRGRPWRHGDDAVRHGHLRQPVAGSWRFGHREGGRQDHRQGQEDRGPSHGSRRRRYRLRAGHLQGRRHRQGRPAGRGGVRGLRAAQLSARGARARHGRERVLRPVELRLPVRHADASARSRSTPTPAPSRS